MKADNGNAVMGALVNLAVGTLLTLSILGVILSSHQLLVIKSVAADAARFSALAEKTAPETQRYALRLLAESLPTLATYQVMVKSAGSRSVVEITSNTPGIGMLPPFILAKARASASYERFS